VTYAGSLVLCERSLHNSICSWVAPSLTGSHMPAIECRARCWRGRWDPPSCQPTAGPHALPSLDARPARRRANVGGLQLVVGRTAEEGLTAIDAAVKNTNAKAEPPMDEDDETAEILVALADNMQLADAIDPDSELQAASPRAVVTDARPTAPETSAVARDNKAGSELVPEQLWPVVEPSETERSTKDDDDTFNNGVGLEQKVDDAISDVPRSVVSRNTIASVQKSASEQQDNQQKAPIGSTFEDESVLGEGSPNSSDKVLDEIAQWVLAGEASPRSPWDERIDPRTEQAVKFITTTAPARPITASQLPPQHMASGNIAKSASLPSEQASAHVPVSGRSLPVVFAAAVDDGGFVVAMDFDQELAREHATDSPATTDTDTMRGAVSWLQQPCMADMLTVLIVVVFLAAVLFVLALLYRTREEGLGARLLALPKFVIPRFPSKEQLPMYMVRKDSICEDGSPPPTPRMHGPIPEEADEDSDELCAELARHSQPSSRRASLLAYGDIANMPLGDSAWHSHTASQWSAPIQRQPFVRKASVTWAPTFP
jgi:hypothetical protein